MSSIMNNKNNLSRSIKKISIAVFLMLSCLFLTSSSSELKKTHKKQHRVGGRRNPFASNPNEKRNTTIENSTEPEIPQEQQPTEAKSAPEEVEKDSNFTVAGDGKKHRFNSIARAVGKHLRKLKNKTSEENPLPASETVAEPLSAEVSEPRVGTVPELANGTDANLPFLNMTNPKAAKVPEPIFEPELPEPIPAEVPEPTLTAVTEPASQPFNQEPMAIFLESKNTAQSKSKLKSKLNSKQNTDPQPNSPLTTTANPVNNPTLNPVNDNNNVNNNNPQQPYPNQLQDPKDPFAFANTKVKCTQVNCPYPSQCVAENVCKCGPEVANFFVDPQAQENPTYYCIYSRKKQLVAFLLEFFIPPIGHFYAGQYLIACIKLILPIVLYLILTFVENTLAKGISAAGLCGMSIWWLVDVILYGTNHYPDQNKVRLAAW